MSDALFSEINIDNFFNMKGEMPFDVYVRFEQGKYVKIFNRGDRIDRDRFEHYRAKGVNQLYIHRKDRRDYLLATERLVQRILSQKNVTDTEAKRAIEELTEQTLFEVYEDRIFDEDSVRRAQTTVRAYVQLVNADVRGLASFINLARNETYLCRHSIATSVFSILLARADSNVNDKMLTIVGMAGLLHDLGMSAIPTELYEADRKLTPEEWAKVKTHPRLASDMIAQVESFPPEVKEAIEQHHECWNGKGYPKGLMWDEIFYPARVVAIADAFSALTTRRAGRALYSPEDAIAIMMTEEGKYDPKLMKTFIGLLNIKKQVA